MQLCSLNSKCYHGKRKQKRQRQMRLKWAKEKVQLGDLICSFTARFSVEEAQRHHRRERWHAGDEGGEPTNDEGEEGDHPGAVPLASLPSAPLNCCHPAALPAAVWHQRCECPPGLDITTLFTLRTVIVILKKRHKKNKEKLFSWHVISH